MITFNIKFYLIYLNIGTADKLKSLPNVHKKISSSSRNVLKQIMQTQPSYLKPTNKF